MSPLLCYVFSILVFSTLDIDEGSSCILRECLRIQTAQTLFLDVEAADRHRNAGGSVCDWSYQAFSRMYIHLRPPCPLDRVSVKSGDPYSGGSGVR